MTYFEGSWMSLSKMPLFPLSYHFESFYFILPFIAFIILQYPSYSGLLSDVCLPLLECKIHKYRVFFPLYWVHCITLVLRKVPGTWWWLISIHGMNQWKFQPQIGAMGPHSWCNSQSLLETLFSPFLPVRHKLRKMHTYKSSYFLLIYYQKQNNFRSTGI